MAVSNWPLAAVPRSHKVSIEAVVREIGRDVDITKDGQLRSDTGVLCYKLSLTLGTGKGPIQIIPSNADDGKPELEKKFITLYHALYSNGIVIDDAGAQVKIEILGRPGRASTRSAGSISCTRKPSPPLASHFISR